MKNLAVFFTIIFSLILLILVFNYKKTQKNLSGSAIPITIDIISSSNASKAHERTQFVWQINASDSVNVKSTAIYYSYESSPSALPANISPQQASYEHHSDDYSYGKFALPDSFDAAIVFPAPGMVYYRIHAQVDKDNYWTPEYNIKIE